MKAISFYDMEPKEGLLVTDDTTAEFYINLIKQGDSDFYWSMGYNGIVFCPNTRDFLGVHEALEKGYTLVDERDVLVVEKDFKDIGRPIISFPEDGYLWFQNDNEWLEFDAYMEYLYSSRWRDKYAGRHGIETPGAYSPRANKYEKYPKKWISYSDWLKGRDTFETTVFEPPTAADLINSLAPKKEENLMSKVQLQFREFTPNDYIWCETQQDLDTLLKMLHDAGGTWISGRSLVTEQVTEAPVAIGPCGVYFSKMNRGSQISVIRFSDWINGSRTLEIRTSPPPSASPAKDIRKPLSLFGALRYIWCETQEEFDALMKEANLVGQFNGVTAPIGFSPYSERLLEPPATNCRWFEPREIMTYKEWMSGSHKFWYRDMPPKPVKLDSLGTICSADQHCPNDKPIDRTKTVIFDKTENAMPSFVDKWIAKHSTIENYPTNSYVYDFSKVVSSCQSVPGACEKSDNPVSPLTKEDTVLPMYAGIGSSSSKKENSMFLPFVLAGSFVRRGLWSVLDWAFVSPIKKTVKPVGTVAQFTICYTTLAFIGYLCYSVYSDPAAMVQWISDLSPVEIRMKNQE